MSMDCKTCRGEGFVSFEAGAVVKRCPKCNGTGSSKFNAICEHIVSPLTKELAELRTANQRLEQECERLSNELNNMRISWGLMQSEREAALKQVEGLRDDLRFLAEYITAESVGNPLPNYLAIGRFPVDVARAALSASPNT